MNNMRLARYADNEHWSRTKSTVNPSPAGLSSNCLRDRDVHGESLVSFRTLHGDFGQFSLPSVVY
jgi:hypothetical protein